MNIFDKKFLELWCLHFKSTVFTQPQARDLKKPVDSPGKKVTKWHHFFPSFFVHSQTKKNAEI